jgi:hypothetical protein
MSITMKPRQGVWFDHRERKWTTTIVEVDSEGTASVEVDRHQTEQEARAKIGLTGGSPDPYYAPKAA